MRSLSYSNYRTITIDFDVHKALTARLESPSDSENGVLRRLLDLPSLERDEEIVALADDDEPATPGTARSDQPAPRRTTSPEWVVDGVGFPQGTEFRRRYKGRLYSAYVDDGTLVYEGTPYDSPSAAAIAITGNSVNGWIWWECKLPGRHNWVRIDSLRTK